jgi:putative spermidine/putrescine transport system permease protein
MPTPSITEKGLPAWVQALPLTLVFAVFFIVPLLLTVMVSFWNYSEYEILPDITARNYVEAFEGCAARFFSASPELCTTLKTYFTTIRICITVWLITLVLGFAIAYFLAFHVRSLTVQVVLLLICTIPF